MPMKSPLSTILSTIIYTPLTMDCCTNYATSGITINHHWLQPLILIHHWEFPVCHVWLLKGSRGYSLIVSTFYPIQKKQVEVVVGSCDVENHWIIHPLIQWLSLFIPVDQHFPADKNPYRIVHHPPCAPQVKPGFSWWVQWWLKHVEALNWPSTWIVYGS